MQFCVNSNECSPALIQQNFHFIARTYLKMIDHVTLSAETRWNIDEESLSQITKYMNTLMYDIPSQRVRYGLKENDHILARYQFQAMCLVHYGSDKQHRVHELFERLRRNNKIGLSIMEMEDHIIVDLSDCEYESEVQFMLSYLIGNHSNKMKGKQLRIITGKIEQHHLNDFRGSKYYEQRVKRRDKLNRMVLDTVDSVISGAQPSVANNNMITIDNVA